jgi:hypothetical protein
VFHNMIFDKPTFLHFKCVHVVCLATVIVSLHINQSICQPWNPFVSKKKPMFQCPMVKLNWCLCVIVWMWHLSKPHHPQIYNKIQCASINFHANTTFLSTIYSVD